LLTLCLNVVLQVYSLSPSWREPFLRSTSLGQVAALDRRVSSSAKCFHSLSSVQNSVIEFKT
jgi:hypothetical protein